MPTAPSRSSSRSASPTPTLVDPPPPSSPTRRNRPNNQLYLDKDSLKRLSPVNSRFPHGHHARSPTSSIASSTLSQRTRHSVDSIWDFDFEAHWERRQREDAKRLQELKGTVPYLTFGRYEEELERVRKEEKASRRVHGFSEDGQSEAASVVSRGPSAIGAAEKNPQGMVGVGGSSETNSVDFEKRKPKGFLGKVDENRRRMRKLMRKKRFHLIMIGLVAFDLVIVMVELIVALLTAGCVNEEIYELLLESIHHHPASHLTPAMFACSLAPTHSREMLENGIFGVNLTLLSIFTLDVFFAIYAFGPITYATSWVTLLDGFVVLATFVVDIYFHFSHDPNSESPIALVILRLWKIFRAAHAIAHALQYHYTEMMEKAEANRKKLEWERISESIRLNCVRSTLIEKTGQDIDPEEVENLVQSEIQDIQKKRKQEEARILQELRTGGMFRCRSRHGGI
ncbi:uncharacterized protein JCM6883_003374 [Sporobolomyces salmoneus]|uniref:uncharacterized protein n=1 Tax=Sporobolomyces salmoneus TaxID=183962 RepID=UPI00317FCD68